MSRHFWPAVRLVLKLQLRSRFPHVYFGVAALSVVIFRTILPERVIPWLLPAFLFGEPGSVGVMMVAAHEYLSRNERSDTAIVVTPLRETEYVTSLIVGSAIVPTLATAVLQAGVQGLDWRVSLIMPPIFLLAIISGALGLMLAAAFPDFTRFLVGSIPPLCIYSLPLLSFFGITSSWAFVWLPSDAAVRVFGHIARDDADAGSYLASVALLTGWAVLACWMATATYTSRIRARVGAS
jgi:fluoroquinolone transport system permease protein